MDNTNSNNTLFNCLECNPNNEPIDWSDYYVCKTAAEMNNDVIPSCRNHDRTGNETLCTLCNDNSVLTAD